MPRPPAAGAAEHGASAEDAEPARSPSRRWRSGRWWSSSGCCSCWASSPGSRCSTPCTSGSGTWSTSCEETERARNESEGLLAEHRRQMARAADEVRAILDKARQDAQAAADQIDQAGPGRRPRPPGSGPQRDIATARDQALAEIWQKTADTGRLDRRPGARHAS